MNLVTVEVEQGINAVNQAGEAFKKIHHSADSVAQQIENFSALSEQMSASAEEVNAAIEEVAGIANSNANKFNSVFNQIKEQDTVMEQFSDAADSLLTMSERLQEMIKKFKV